MADSKFFARKGPFTLQEIAELSGAELPEGVDPAYVIEDVAPLDIADSKQLSFLDNMKYKEQFKGTKAGACFVSDKLDLEVPSGVYLLVSKSPYKSYALTAQAFYPDAKPESRISQHARIHPDAKISDGCTIESGVVIRKNAKIGKNTWIESNTVIGAGVVVGDHCRIGSNATVSHAEIGSYTRLYPGVRVGQDGFGFAIDPAGHVKVPQLGRVIIGDHVEIGANATIDRGAGPDTVIGQGTWIDNLVQVAHNVKIGRGCVIAAQVGIAGSTVLEDFVAVGGQAGMAGHLTIGMGAQIGAQSGVISNIAPGQDCFGTPAIPRRDKLKQAALLNRLIREGK